VQSGQDLHLRKPKPIKMWRPLSETRNLSSNNFFPRSYFFIYLSIALHPFSDLGRFFSFLILHTFGRTPWNGDQPAARPLPTHRTTQTQNKRIQTSMPRVGFEPTIQVFERAKTVHALDRAVTLIGSYFL
jgi:hypothetical protein